MKRVVGNHVGIVVNVNDPENRGRVQVYVPHISTTLYNNWNEKLKDIKSKLSNTSGINLSTAKINTISLAQQLDIRFDSTDPGGNGFIDESIPAFITGNFSTSYSMFSTL